MKLHLDSKHHSTANLVAPPQPIMEFGTETQQTNADGLLMWTLNVVFPDEAVSSSGKLNISHVKVASKTKPDVKIGLIRLVGPTAYYWTNNNRSGVSLSAEAVTQGDAS